MFPVKVCLALGGGAARGLAHLGVIEVLTQSGVPINGIAGTSMGALVGALYARSEDARTMVDEALRYVRSPEFAEARIHRLHRETAAETSVVDAVSRYISRGRVLASTVTRPSVLDAEDLYELLGYFLDDRDIRTLRVPFCAVAADLRSGSEVVIDAGPVIDAVAASSAVPGAFPPIRLGGRDCVDGGVLDMVPVRVARAMGADYVIASNVTHELPVPNEAMRALSVHFRTHEITKRALTRMNLCYADVIITPEVTGIHWADFTRPEAMLEAGRGAARAAIQHIRNDLTRLSRRPRFLRGLRRPPDEPPEFIGPAPSIEPAAHEEKHA